MVFIMSLSKKKLDKKLEKKWLFRSVLFLTFIATHFHLTAQTLKGKIVDESNIALRGAYVIHLASEHHAHTNHLGLFELPGIKDGDVIQVTHVGFETVVMEIQEVKQELLIQMKEAIIDLSEITVNPGIDPLNLVSKIDIGISPVKTSQEVLRKVPGLFIGQHAGGGKAEQIFLRGFDIDHGTDVNITVDGLPVNMVSHAHGQGYADLHWLIPEAIENIDFGKGPYNANKGNFATAGYVNFQTKKRLDKSQISFEGGSFGAFRTVGLFKLLDEENSDAYIASEYSITDGPFEASQRFSRINVMGKYNARLNNGGTLSLLASHFESNWNASGQIPLRAVRSGQISRFGALDDTEGGVTGRNNVALTYTKPINNNTYLRNNVYFSQYDFELYSNFTFFLEDPVNGDQIRQVENRNIFGAESELSYETDLGGNDLELQVAVGFRNDNNQDVELSHTVNRDSTLELLSLGDIQERNIYSYINADLELGRLTINPGLRFDYFQFNYEDKLKPAFDPQTNNEFAVSPKINFIYNVNENFQAYLKSGIGFHSNDTRVVINEEADEILPLAFGSDLGATWKPAPRLVINAALWYLFLEQEFVYVGDAGIVEPSGETKRLGTDLGVRYQLNKWLYADGDFTFSRARALPDNEFIPLAPRITATGGLSVNKNNFSGALKFRYLQDRPANEDNSVVAEGYTVFDANANYRLGGVTLGVQIENLFDVDWIETQFDTESRIRQANGTLEEEAVSEIHFTPGTPFGIRFSVKYQF